MCDIDYMMLGSRIRARRQKKDFTQKQVASMTGLSVVHISNVGTGSTKVGLPTLLKISNVIGCGVDELLSGNLPSCQHVFEGELSEIIEDCSENELRVMANVLRALKESLRN